MDESASQILGLIAKVRTRWRRLAVLQAAVRSGALIVMALGFGLLAAGWAVRWPVVLGLIAAVLVAIAVAAVVLAMRRVGPAPSDVRVARFVEEAVPDLDDRLASAVDLLSSRRELHGLAGPLLDDVARRIDRIDGDAVVSSERVRKAAALAVATVLLIGAMLFLGRGVIRQSTDVIAFSMFPSRVTLEVTPGSARVRAGTTVTIAARLSGNGAPLDVRLLRAPADGEDEQADWAGAAMARGASGNYTIDVDVTEPFRYRVVAGGASSEVFVLSVLQPPRVTRIDLDYTYPRALGLDPRTDEDGGDIYAPAGTTVRLRVHVEGDTDAGRLALDDGSQVALAEESGVWSGALTVAKDGTYHVALADADGVEATSSAEYFIRTLEDRPPDVRVLRPARDRDVTELEEVEIEAEAHDDFGLARFDLVYAVGGGPEVVVPFDLPRRATSVTSGRVLFLEDLDVSPGDFISYYVRARDVARGAQSREARSDIFFLQVRSFNQQFRLAGSQAAGANGQSSVDDLVAAQKEIIVATWQLDRRAATAGGEVPQQDIAAVARAEADVKTRVEQASSARRTQTLRSPRRVGPGRAPAAGQVLPGEDAMIAAAAALERAVASLEARRTTEALPAEMEALDHLLKAQDEVQERQVTSQQAGAGGSNRSGQDLSGLFDRELQAAQSTNYENRQSLEQPEQNQGEDLLGRVRELARRQDQLLREQQELERNRAQLAEAERRRELERLTREQNQLREQAEQLARELGPSGQSGQTGQSGQGGQPGQGSRPEERMRSASASMRDAADGLGRQSSDAVERSAQALDQLRQIERELQGRSPGEQQRALGNSQFEAREMAEAQRAIGSASQSGPAARSGNAGGEQARRLAGDQQRLADRLDRLQAELERQGASPAQETADDGVRGTAAAVAQEIDRQRLVERMQEAADGLRAAGESSNPPADGAAGVARQQASEEIARALDQLADRLAAASGSSDPESRRLASQLARAQDIRDRMERATRELERLDRDAAQPGGASGGDAASLRTELENQLRGAQSLLEELRKEDPDALPRGMGFTYEGQGMVLSAPGTEAFKQDLSRWEELRRQATQVLDAAQTSVAARLRARESQDRFASGLDDRTPAEYQSQVDSYFKALAGRPVR